MFDVGCWMLDVGCWMLDVGCWMLDVRDVEFIAAGGALIGAHSSFHDDAGFLGEAFDGVEDFRRNGIFRHYTLNDAGAVAKLGKEELATFAEIVEPSPDGDGLAFVGADLCDGTDGCGHKKFFTAESRRTPGKLDSSRRGFCGTRYYSDPKNFRMRSRPRLSRSEERRVGKECRSRWSP